MSFDEHLVRRLGSLVGRVRWKELALKLRWHKRACGDQDGEEGEKRADADQDVPVEQSTCGAGSAVQATSVVKSFLRRPSARNCSARIAPSFFPRTCATWRLDMFSTKRSTMTSCCSDVRCFTAPRNASTASP